MLCYPLVFRFYSMGSYMYTVGSDVDTSLFYAATMIIAVPTELKFLVVSYTLWLLSQIKDTTLVYLRLPNFIYPGRLERCC